MTAYHEKASLANKQCHHIKQVEGKQRSINNPHDSGKSTRRRILRTGNHKTYNYSEPPGGHNATDDCNPYLQKEGSCEIPPEKHAAGGAISEPSLNSKQHLPRQWNESTIGIKEEELLSRHWHGPPSKIFSSSWWSLPKRLKTFDFFPRTCPVHAEDLALAGFIYTNTWDLVECPFCVGQLMNWGPEDIPFLEHKRHFPYCIFVKEQSKTPLKDDSHRQNVRLMNPWNTGGSRDKAGNPFNEDTTAPVSCPLSKDMTAEYNRLSTFDHWPKDCPVRPVELARAGFYYTPRSDRDDRATCAFCNGSIHKWIKGDTALGEHTRLFPDCPFVKEKQADARSKDIALNVLKTIGKEKSSETFSQPKAFPRDVSKSTQAPEEISGARKYGKTKGPQVPVSNTNRQHPKESAKRRDLNSATKLNPLYPEYVQAKDRFSTFYEWPDHKTQRAQDLSRAGFFYEGNLDIVLCFHCGVGLCGWQPEEDPWIEHARWAPTCEFLQITKGSDFVKDVQRGMSIQGKSKSEPIPVSAKLDTSEMEAKMLNPITQKAMEIGYSKDVVRRVVQKRLEDNGAEFPNLQSLLQALLDAEEQ
ncbi:E3 ubiquitin-protein ligase XIAP-like [Lingula anatina]|uniref:E3 ubiquitin-protein ligase XIAP-like n=1 Tax=Lingula anatina TaxID=7574 RepID=A0A2R2MKL0_LINAN|nr:E3 ubiquitin-protein ligase XIAP-like [Lingula anatina]XP_023930754.1 E3 ubiquitin-protein ligase XIAP-like [Lingula anatina]|eukprot:XP_023930751.1 E3 ubiquitin-protein ligase XIAP-like [Lingula anatina]